MAGVLRDPASDNGRPCGARFFAGEPDQADTLSRASSDTN